jgi:hypothetical protein
LATRERGRGEEVVGARERERTACRVLP